ncbi:MAG: peptide-methionine (S)-S-oxide reductase MsrA [Rhizobiales bacterium]|nr:peptide-methionine (S)-S-oxide reductase MsrA [Hyphomicrobiales bacterium]
MVLPAAAAEGTKTLVVAGGCFWCVESDFDKVPGVVATVSGYAGGTLENPSYYNHADHIEAVEITYDPAKVSFERLTEIFWRSIDPTDGGGQFCDRGHSYTTAIFTSSLEERAIVERQKAEIEASGQLGAPIVTAIRGPVRFWVGEDYHQNFHKTNPVRYYGYRYGCGRDARVKQLWGKDAWGGIDHSGS